MNVVSMAWRWGVWVVWVALALGLAAGCASKPKVDWSARVGTGYTFDDAVKELGPPDKSTTLADGGRVADWYTGQGPSFSFGFGTGSYGHGSAVGVGQAVTAGGNPRYLRLTFSADGKLVEQQRVGK